MKEAYLVVGPGVWGRGYVLEARLNGGPPIALFNVLRLMGMGKGEVFDLVHPGFRVDPRLLRPGVNDLHLRVYAMPGCKPVVPIRVTAVWIHIES